MPGSVDNPVSFSPMRTLTEVGWDNGDFVLITMAWYGVSNGAVQAILTSGPVSQKANVDGIGAGNLISGDEDTFPREGTQQDPNESGLKGSYIKIIAGPAITHEQSFVDYQGISAQFVHIEDRPHGWDFTDYPPGQAIYKHPGFPSVPESGGPPQSYPESNFINPTVHAKLADFTSPGGGGSFFHNIRDNPSAEWADYSLNPYDMESAVLNPLADLPHQVYRLDVGVDQFVGPGHRIQNTGISYSFSDTNSFDEYYWYRRWDLAYDFYFEVPFFYIVFFVNVSKIYKDFKDHYTRDILNPSPPPITVGLKGGFFTDFAESLDLLQPDQIEHIRAVRPLFAKRRFALYKGSALKTFEDAGGEFDLPLQGDGTLETNDFTIDELMDLFRIKDAQGNDLMVREVEEDSLSGTELIPNMATITSFTWDYANRSMYGVYPSFQNP